MPRFTATRTEHGKQTRVTIRDEHGNVTDKTQSATMRYVEILVSRDGKVIARSQKQGGTPNPVHSRGQERVVVTDPKPAELAGFINLAGGTFTPATPAEKAAFAKANTQSKEDTTMARTPRKSTPAKRTSRKATPAPAPAEKKGNRKHDDAALTTAVLDRHVNGDESLGSVAKDLGITPGKAAFLILLHEADTTPKLRRKATAEDAAQVILEMRNDDLLSWGQIAARLFVDGKRISEPKIKRLFDEAGGTRGLVTKVRKGDEDAAPAAKPAAKRTGKAQATAAKKTPARRTRKPSNPSKA